MINKEFLQAINPKEKPYNPKYSEGTYTFLHRNRNKDVKVYWKKKDNINGDIVSFDPSDIRSPQIYFMYRENGDWFGVSWYRIMSNKYKVLDYSSFEMDGFDDITEWFCNEYIRVGRCLFDSNHINFLLGENNDYVGEHNRFEIIDGVKSCRWCGKEIK